jgi:hypothetical protein
MLLMDAINGVKSGGMKNMREMIVLKMVDAIR